MQSELDQAAHDPMHITIEDLKTRAEDVMRHKGTSVPNEIWSSDEIVDQVSENQGDLVNSVRLWAQVPRER